jgi:FolB domain-containing protein
MSDQVIIRDLRVRGIIGVYDQERIERQDILINVVIYTDLHLAGISDDIDDSIDYGLVIEEVSERVIQTAYRTVEALAEDIAKVCLKNPKSQRVIVRVEKTQALPAARSVGVQIERHRE